MGLSRTFRRLPSDGLGGEDPTTGIRPSWRTFRRLPGDGLEQMRPRAESPDTHDLFVVPSGPPTNRLAVLATRCGMAAGWPRDGRGMAAGWLRYPRHSSHSAGPTLSTIPAVRVSSS